MLVNLSDGKEIDRKEKVVKFITDSLVRKLHSEIELALTKNRKLDVRRLGELVTVMFNEVSRYDFSLQTLQPDTNENSVTMITWMI